MERPPRGMAEENAFAGSDRLARPFQDRGANSGMPLPLIALAAGAADRLAVRPKPLGLTVTCESILIPRRKFEVRVFGPLSAHYEHVAGRSQSNERILSPSTRRFEYD